MIDKNEKVLMIVHSALELLLAVQTKLSLLSENETIIVIPNRTSDAYKHYKNLKKTNLFDDVIFVDSTNYPIDKKYKEYEEPEKSEIFRKACISEAKTILQKHNNITAFFSSEIDYFSQYMYQAVMDTAKPYYIGEGAFVFWGLESSIKNEMSLRKVFLLERLKDIFFYGPKLAELNGYNMIEIPSINNNRGLYTKYVNQIFGYEPHKRRFKNKIIFFEETYCRDGGMDDAVEFVELLVKEFGSNNVIVKKHPRSNINRFSHLSVDSVEPSSIPWELFIINADCEDCVLLSANSASVYLCKIWDFCIKKNDCIMLSNIMHYKYLNEPSYISYYRRLSEFYLDNGFYVPNTKDELIQYIKNTHILDCIT